MLLGRLGKGWERISDRSFRAMAVLLHIRDFLSPPMRRAEQWGISEGDTVVDYGCGAGSYLPAFADLVGAGGRVYAVDIHPLAIAAVERLKAERNLDVVGPVLANGYPSPLDARIADIVCALDMFHMVRDQQLLLAELHRILKDDGRLVIDRGHLPEAELRQGLGRSGLWQVQREAGAALICAPTAPLQRN
jgi:SAM-dependent methyltransferase